jgi:hypothetical protein
VSMVFLLSLLVRPSGDVPAPSKVYVTFCYIKVCF